MSYYGPQGHVNSDAHKIIAWIVAITTSLYMLPWAIAATRDKSSATSIALVNFFLGWTGIGWFWALIWSFMSEPVTVSNQYMVVPMAQVGPATYAPSPYAGAYPEPAGYAAQPEYQYANYPGTPVPAPSASHTAVDPYGQPSGPQLPPDPYAPSTRPQLPPDPYARG